jgi:hypothetical protein
MKITKTRAYGATLASLTLFLTSCAGRSPDVSPCYPPVVYLQEVPEPLLTGPTNKALAEWTAELRAALKLANSDKAALREWAENLSE